MARLSLCMIVKDEEEMLPRFLSHARGLWDELVAVDTGSTDSTPRLLEAAGARLVHRPWTGDFALARNASLEEATSDWICFLDADELVDPSMVASARALLDDAAAGAATVLMRNQLPHGHVREARLLRFFRNDPAIRFRHAIHEDPSDGVFAHLNRTGRHMRHLAGFVEHLGYVRSRAAAKDKKARDVAILERCLSENPLDLYAHLKRLEQARFWNDRPLWARAAADARGALDQALPASSALADAPFAGELVVLIADGLYSQAPRQAIELLDEWAARCAPSAAFHLRRGELSEALGLVERAAADFTACLALEPVTPNRQLATVRPRLGLARLALARGDLAAALATVEHVLADSPRDPEALLAAVALQRAKGGSRAVLAFAAAHEKSSGACAELHEAVGEEALLAGDVALAISALTRAAGQPPQGRAALGLARALLASGAIDSATMLSRTLSTAQAEAGLVLLCCDLVAGRDSDLELDMEMKAAEDSLRRTIGAVLAVGRASVLEPLRHHAPAVAQVFPWLPAALAR